jgi:5-methylcytosine-specific restriction protein A
MGLVSTARLASAHRLLDEVVDELCAAAGAGAADDELLSVLMLCEGMARRLDRLVVDTVADLQRRGSFAERGYTSTAGALGDLMGWERHEARRRLVAAEQVSARVGLDGAALPARLPATAEVFAAGRAGLRHVEVIARLLDSPAAGRLAPQVWAAAEVQLSPRPASTPPLSWPRGAPRWSRPSTRTGPNPTTARPRCSTSCT